MDAAARKRKPSPTWFKELLATLRPGIERQTLLMPWVIADSVLGEASRFLNTDLPDEWIDLLDAKAERCFTRPNRQFHRLISSNANHGNAGRDALYMFMPHWLAGILYKKRRDLFRSLPQSFGLGMPLRGSPQE